MSAPPNLDSTLAFLKDDLEKVERALVDGLKSISPLIPKIGEDTVASGGKRIRPRLVLLSARLLGYAGPRAIAIAAATAHTSRPPASPSPSCR